MMFMPDAIKGTIELMEAEASKLSVRSSYNLGGITFTPKELAEEIKKFRTGFEISYQPDFRQAIADSWPQSIDDKVAVADWSWKQNFGLSEMTEIMLKEIKKKFII